MPLTFGVGRCRGPRRKSPVVGLRPALKTSYQVSLLFSFSIFIRIHQVIHQYYLILLLFCSDLITVSVTVATVASSEPLNFLIFFHKCRVRLRLSKSRLICFCFFVILWYCNRQNPDPRRMQINLTGFLNGKNARIFMSEMWDLLLSAQESVGGIPEVFMAQKKEEIAKRAVQFSKLKFKRKYVTTAVKLYF
jgi:hypothetical protein